MSATLPDLDSRLSSLLDPGYYAELVAFRRDLHAHPELGRRETRTTAALSAKLTAAGLRPRVLPGGTGVICDIEAGSGGSAGRPLLALRADIDALPLQDEKPVPYRSTVDGVCHACGHDLHTTMVLGAGVLLAEASRRGALPGGVRLIFQPAEEMIPGGALDVIDAGGLEGVGRILGLHCDPRIDVGLVGLRTGPITAACDKLLLRVAGPGGHTARPHLTVDLVYALSSIVTTLPAALSRRIDPRAGLSLVWGRIQAGNAANAIPQSGEAEGTVRCLDDKAWRDAPDIILETIDAIAGAYGVKTELEYLRGVPPVVNEADSVALMRTVATGVLSASSVVTAEQSLGGEDFAWYLRHVPGAMARLGVRTPGEKVVRDLHQGTFDADERAIAAGVRLLVEAALADW